MKNRELKIGTLMLSVFMLGVTLFAQLKEEGTVYIVKQGDTLWNISSRFLNNPWIWPKVWEQNRYITNPHLIFPGDPIVLGIAAPSVASLPPPPVAGIPTQAKETTLSSEEMTAGPEEAPPPPPQEGVSSDEMAAIPEAELVQPEEALGEISKIEAAQEGSIFYSAAQSVGFISGEEFEAAGSIVGTKLERKLFGEHDEVYISTVVDAQPGQKFTIFRVLGKFKHPVTGANLGYRIKTLGVLEVSEKGETSSNARITMSFDVIQKGDRLSPIEPMTKEIVLRTSSNQMNGYIVGSQNDAKLIGEGQIVYIDKGSADGITEGNVFTVYKPESSAKDPLTGARVNLPVEIIGKLVIIKARENVSTALVTRSKKELNVENLIVSDMF